MIELTTVLHCCLLYHHSHMWGIEVPSSTMVMKLVVDHPFEETYNALCPKKIVSSMSSVVCLLLVEYLSNFVLLSYFVWFSAVLAV